MTQTVLVELSEDQRQFSLKGGEPRVKDEVYNIVSSWPGWRRRNFVPVVDGRKTSHYTAPVWAHTAISLALTTMHIEWGEAAREMVDALLSTIRVAEQHLASKATPKDLAKSAVGKRVPLNHQWQARNAAALMQDRLLLSDDMGLGKASASLWMAEYRGAQRVLVICPASVKYNWKRETEITLGCEALIIDGTPKKRADMFPYILSRLPHHDGDLRSGTKLVVIINYDLLIHLAHHQVGILEEFTAQQALICDESHYLKNRKSERTRFVMQHLAPAKGGARLRILCTGTPVRNLVDDLWSQIEILRPGTWTSYWDFERRYLVTALIDFGGPKPVDTIVGTRNLPELNRIVNTMQIRRLKKNVLHLPPKIHTYPELELTGDHLRVYKAMKNFAVLELSELDPSQSIFSPQARSAVIAAMRCEQIAQGFAGGVPEPLVEQLAKILSKKAKPIPGRPKEIVFPDSPKMVWMIENIETLLKTDHRPVIFSRFNAPMFWLRDQFPDDAKVLSGAATSKQKGDLIQSFQDGDFPLLFVQVLMAEGFNLHNSQDCIFLGRDWSPAVNHQAEDRLHRIGQKGTVNIQIPIVRGTIEQLIHDRLMAKSANTEQALKHVTVKELMEAL